MKLFFLAVSLLLLVFSARAAEVLACPAWEIVVVDAAGKGVAGCNVAQEWGCAFRTGYVGAATNAVTDAMGKVVFPARLVSGPPPEASRWKRFRRALDGPENPQPAASVIISKPGHRMEWIRKNDPGVVATKSGLRLRLMLRPEKP